MRQSVLLCLPCAWAKMVLRAKIKQNWNWFGTSMENVLDESADCVEYWHAHAAFQSHSCKRSQWGDTPTITSMISIRYNGKNIDSEGDDWKVATCSVGSSCFGASSVRSSLLGSSPNLCWNVSLSMFNSSCTSPSIYCRLIYFVCFVFISVTSLDKQCNQKHSYAGKYAHH